MLSTRDLFHYLSVIRYIFFMPNIDNVGHEENYIILIILYCIKGCETRYEPYASQMTKFSES
jgi:hypothetical protein